MNIKVLKTIKTFLQYSSIVLGAIVALLSAIFSSGLLFYLLSGLGLLIAILGQFISSRIENEIKLQEEKELIIIKKTPPLFRIDLKFQDLTNYLVLIKFQNFIPIKFKVAILDDKNIFLGGIQLDWAEIYPTEESSLFNYKTYINKMSDNNILVLKFDYQSVWMAEFNKNDLKGTIYVTYQLNGNILTCIKEEYIQ